jgi:hypothetical protein
MGYLLLLFGFQLSGGRSLARKKASKHVMYCIIYKKRGEVFLGFLYRLWYVY